MPNMNINIGYDAILLITSLYDIETGCAVPTILSDPMMAVYLVDLREQL